MTAAAPDRRRWIARGRALEFFSLAYNCLEGSIALAAGWLAGSISLMGFGLDSAIEAASSAALLWRLRQDHDESRRETIERASLRIVGWCFLALAVYVACDSTLALLDGEKPHPSIPGIALAAVSMVVMPLLARGKRRVAAGIGSAALHADSRQTDFCLYLSAVLLGGLLLNAMLGWWWADPAAALVMVPLIAREGVAALRGKSCDSC
jgi:divalent metal cation (Fe/Co/Zn/Cd) transporter